MVSFYARRCDAIANGGCFKVNGGKIMVLAARPGCTQLQRGCTPVEYLST